jgi:hypothetical protein
MGTALVVITIKQRAERIRSMTASMVALGADGICEIIPTSPRCEVPHAHCRDIATALMMGQLAGVLAWALLFIDCALDLRRMIFDTDFGSL